jgi:hypothetical protein
MRKREKRNFSFLKAPKVSSVKHFKLITFSTGGGISFSFNSDPLFFESILLQENHCDHLEHASCPEYG